MQSLRSLDDEEKSDLQLREQFKERWSRTPSQTLTKPMREEANKYRTILDTAIQADKIVREKYEKNKQAITLLSKPPVSCFCCVCVCECVCVCRVDWLGIVDVM